MILDRIKYTDRIEAKNVQISGCSFFQAENGCGNYSDDTKDTKACMFTCQGGIFNMAKFDHIVCGSLLKFYSYSLFILWVGDDCNKNALERPESPPPKMQKRGTDSATYGKMAWYADLP